RSALAQPGIEALRQGLEEPRRARQGEGQAAPPRDPGARGRDRARDRRVPQDRADGAEGRARGAASQEGDGGGEPAPREPTPEELAEKLGMPLEKVRKVLKIVKEPLSLETPIGDEENSHLGDFIEDKNAILPIDAAIQSNLRETTTRTLASLTPREERIIRMRFGLSMNKDHTLEEVGQ